jgi:hypothetical protein
MTCHWDKTFDLLLRMTEELCRLTQQTSDSELNMIFGMALLVLVERRQRVEDVRSKVA